MKNRWLVVFVLSVAFVFSVSALAACNLGGDDKTGTSTDISDNSSENFSDSDSSQSAIDSSGEQSASSTIESSDDDSSGSSEEDSGEGASEEPKRTFIVTVTSTGRGNVISDKQKVDEGGKVELTAATEKGWYLSSITVNGEEKIGSFAGGKLVIENVPDNLEVKGVFSPSVVFAATKPLIDGKIDSVWSTAAKLKAETYYDETLSPAQSQGYFSVLWAKSGLYFIAVVEDENVCSDDGIEIFLSESAKDVTDASAFSTDKADGQYALSIKTDGSVSSLFGFDLSSTVVSAATSNIDGYIIEAFIPRAKQGAFSGESEIGFNAVISSYTAAGEKQAESAYTEFAEKNDVNALENILLAAIPQGVTIETHTVSFDTNGAAAKDPIEVEDGDVLSLDAEPTMEGFVFDGWYLSGVLFDKKAQIKSDITLVAHWEATRVVSEPYVISAGGPFEYAGLNGNVVSAKLDGAAVATQSGSATLEISATYMQAAAMGEHVITAETDKGYTYILSVTVNLSNNDVVIAPKTVSANDYSEKDFVTKESLTIDFSDELAGSVTYATLDGANVLSKMSGYSLVLNESDISSLTASKTYKAIIGNSDKVAICEIRFATYSITTAAQFVNFYNAYRTNRANQETTGWYISIEADLDFSAFTLTDYNGGNWGDLYLSNSGNTNNSSLAEDSFGGVIEGNGHVIKGLRICRYLFATSTATTAIRNLAFTDLYYTSTNQSTGLFYYVRGGEISNCYFGGTFANTTNNADGIAYIHQSTTTIKNVIVNMNHAGTASDNAAIGHTFGGNNATKHDNYAIGNFAMMYQGSSEGLYPTIDEFFAAVHELPKENGWSEYWDLSSAILKFNGKVVIMKATSLTTFGTNTVVSKDLSAKDFLAIDLTDEFDSAITYAELDGADVSEYIEGTSIKLPSAVYSAKTVGTEYVLIASNEAKTYAQRIKFATLAISTAEEFKDFYAAYRTNKSSAANTSGWYISIEDDIDFSAWTKTEYGNSEATLDGSGNAANNEYFAGTIEGNGHYVKGLGVTRYLFCRTTDTTVIKNIAFIDLRYTAKATSAGLIYIMVGTSITNCYFGGTFANTSNNADGIMYNVWGGTPVVQNVIVNMTHAGTTSASGAIAHTIGSSATRKNNYAIGNFSTMYNGSTDGLYESKAAFFAAVSELPKENGWNELWTMDEDGVKFNGTLLIEK